MMRWWTSVAKVVTVAVMLAWGVACGKSDDGAAASAHLAQEVVQGTSTNCAVVLTAQQGTKFTVTIAEGSEWCHFSGGVSEVSGVMAEGENSRTLFLYFEKNSSGASREASIVVVFEGAGSQTLRLTQESYDENIAFSREWPELPVCDARDGYIYRSYSAKVGAKSNVRNYTICYNPEYMAAEWVAYPMHLLYTNGSADRDNSSFTKEPTIAANQQMNGYYKSPYNRGHQIAAADRKCSQEMMDQTFYVTNMTPQLGRFNSTLWGSLEGKVRSEWCYDTLYVVTGAYFKGKHDSSIATSTTDSSGKRCPIPSHYYKLLLKTVKGDSGKKIADITNADELQAIAIFIPHHDSGSSTVLKDEWFMSVEELEKIVGFEFFPMLNDAVEDEVKRQNNRSMWF